MIGTNKPATRGRVAGVEVSRVASGFWARPGGGSPGVFAGEVPKHREVPCSGGRDHTADGGTP